VARFLNRDGTLNVRRLNAPSDWCEDMFHSTVRAGWVRIFFGFVALYLATAAIFAVLYSLQPSSLAGLDEGSAHVHVRWLRTFFFSSLALSGAGHEVIHPATPYGHVLLVVESLLGLFGFALFTGLFFSKFSLPRARVRFSERALLTSYEGRRALVFRLANERDVPIIGAQAEAWLVRTIHLPEGTEIRRPVQLHLARSRVAALVLAWTVVHYLDEDSPFDEEELAGMVGGPDDLYLMVTGTDAVTGAPVSVFQAYDGGQVTRGGRFRDMVGFCEDGSRIIDYAKLSEVDPLAEFEDERCEPGDAAAG
jgi:inward rectifier potassium channel